MNLMQVAVLKVMNNDHFLVLLAIWVFFSEVFGQVNGWPILKLREMIRVLHVVACPILFILFHDPN